MSDVENLKKSVKNMPLAEEKPNEPDINEINLVVSEKTQTEPEIPEEPSVVKEEAEVEEIVIPEIKEIKSSKEASETESNNNDRILKLYKEGKSNVQIAKELGLGVGEVRLVVDLFKNAK